jgi:hypothetical protein
LYLLCARGHTAATSRSAAPFLKILLLKGGRVVETVDAKWTSTSRNCERGRRAGAQHAADDWEIVNEIGALVMPKSRRNTMMR